MVIDTSALVAILFGEAESDALLEAMVNDPIRLMSALTALEAAVVIEARKGAQGSLQFELFMHHANIEVVAFTPEHYAIARAAWKKYGKGRHPAGLNLGDCCSYALSKYSGEPLLFKGHDFSQTDITLALS